jgi:hypothetical protein
MISSKKNKRPWIPIWVVLVLAILVIIGPIIYMKCTVQQKKFEGLKSHRTDVLETFSKGTIFTSLDEIVQRKGRFSHIFFDAQDEIAHVVMIEDLQVIPYTIDLSMYEDKKQALDAILQRLVPYTR